MTENEQATGNVVPERLRELVVFEFLSDDQRRVLAGCLREQPMRPEQVFLREGDEARELILVVQGKVEARLETPLGSQTVASLRSGDLVGEISLIDSLPVSSTVVSVSDGLLLVFDLPRLSRLTTEDAALEAGLLRTFCRSLAGKIREANRAMTEIMAPGAAASGVTTESKAERGGIDDATKRSLLAEHGLSDEERQVLLNHLEADRFSRGDTIFAEGSTGDTLYIVAEGEVRISRRIPGMGEEALAILRRGEIFGEMAWIDRSPRSADAIAHSSSCTVLGVSRRRMEEANGQDAESSVQLLRVLCQLLCRRIRAMNSQLVAWRTMAFY